MLGNFLIGLREGLEAALVVSILITYLVRTNRQHLIKAVWRGVVVAAAVSAIVSITLQLVSAELSDKIEPIFAGVISILAVVFVTWMIFWMKRSARSMSGELRSALDRAELSGGATAVAVMAFLAVAREGVETAIFYWAAAHSTSHALTSFIGLSLGLGAAVVLGVGFYKSTLKINLGTFFKITGVLLVFVAAGVLAAGIHEFQEIGWLPGVDSIAVDISSMLHTGTTVAVVLEGLLNITPTITTLQVLVWVTYSVIVLWLFLRTEQVTAPTEIAEPSQV